MSKRSKAQISYNMSQIKSRNTTIEKLLNKAFRKNKIRFRTNSKLVFGKPDFVIHKAKIAIFCDSAFWHGYRFKKTKRHNFKTRKKFWENKIRSNIKRDKIVNLKLKVLGWKVFRFWDFELKKGANNCAIQVKKYIALQSQHRKLQ